MTTASASLPNVAEELLRAEGFTDIRYVEAPGSQQVDALVRGELDFTNFLGASIPLIDAGVPITVLAGIHIGCFELLARQGVRHIADLNGKTIGLRVTPVDLLKLNANFNRSCPPPGIHGLPGRARHPREDSKRELKA